MKRHLVGYGTYDSLLETNRAALSHDELTLSFSAPAVFQSMGRGSKHNGKERPARVQMMRSENGYVSRKGL